MSLKTVFAERSARRITILAACLAIFPLLMSGCIRGGNTLSDAGANAGTNAGPHGVAMLVFDPDPKGANVRETPGGKVAKVIPARGRTDADMNLRRVIVVARDGEWFQARLADGSSGWIHGSMLGARVAPRTDNTNTPIHVKPAAGSALVTKVIKLTPVWLLDVSGSWAKVKFYESSGNTIEGWMEGDGFMTDPRADLVPLQNAAARLKAAARKSE